MQGLWRWLPPIAWMGVIYFLSTDHLSMPGVRQGWTGFLGAKATHAAEYAVLALLWYRAVSGHLVSWSRRGAIWAFLVTAAYAVLDELHQSLTLHRSGNAGDVTLDWAGALAALGTVRALAPTRGGSEPEGDGERRGHADRSEPRARFRSWVVRSVLVTCSVVLTVLLLEWLLRLVAPQPLNFYNFALLNEKGVVEKSAGLWTGGSLYRVNIKPPGKGPMRANTRMRMGEVDIEVNEHGWRDRTYPSKAPPGTYRLMVVGDSVTFGYGVPLTETYHKRLEDRLNQGGSAVGKRFEVIALAGGGGTTYDALRMVRHHIGYFEPRELWLAFNLNDVLYEPYRLLDQARRKARATPQLSLRDRAIMMMGWLRAKADVVLRPRSHLYHLMRQRSKALLRYFGIYSPTLQPEAAFVFSSDRAQGAWSATLRAILEIREEAARHRARFAVVVLPADPQTSRTVAAVYRNQFHFRFDDDFVTGVVQQRICADLRERDVECVDPLPLFRAHADRQLFLRVYGDSVDWNHPNVAGHSVLARALLEAVGPRLLSEAGLRPRPIGN